MGLDTTHDCWHGAYSAFMRFRENLASAIGLELRQMEWFTDNGRPFPAKEIEPLVILLMHSDCDGDIEVEDLLPLAARLEEVATLIESGAPPDDATGLSITRTSDGIVVERHGGHLTRNGGTVGAARTFAEGCRLAASLGEKVGFH